ncbi:hypothetical protein DFQ30_003488 [Apophysomyces sp. BC1015]|nr:hypothetical protein DFQ30_003488 [Apophysomyces sp. BC1015]
MAPNKTKTPKGRTQRTYTEKDYDKFMNLTNLMIEKCLKAAEAARLLDIHKKEVVDQAMETVMEELMNSSQAEDINASIFRHILLN